MKSLHTVFVSSLAAVFMSVAPVHASTINVTLGATGSDLTYGSGSDVTSPNVDLTALGSGMVLNTNAHVIIPPVTVINQYIKPSGPLFGNSYLAVLGEPLTGSATFTFASDMNKFAFTWGTIDTYNTLTLTDSRNVTYAITGASLLSRIAGSVAGTTQTDVTFHDPLGWLVTAQLTSAANSFEAANFSQTDPPSSVPLPAALPLFGAALLSLGFMRRKIV